MKQIPKVYVDTGVMIQGSQYPEHEQIIKLAKEESIELYYGDEVSIELRQQIYDLREEKEKIIKKEDKYHKEEFMKELRRIESEIQNKEKQVKTELEYWREAKPKKVNNTFRGLILILETLGEQAALRYDFKNELKNLSKLIEDFNIKPMDAIHAMQAHSSNMAYFLTWDKRFLKRAKRVNWLAPEFMTPKEFIWNDLHLT